MFSPFAVKLHNPQGNATYSVKARNGDLAQICVPETTSADVILQNPRRRTSFDSAETFQSERVCVCLCVRRAKRERAPQHCSQLNQLPPAGLRTVLHHGDSRIHDATFEPQPGPDQMLDFVIKYLLAPVNHPTSVRRCNGRCEIRLLTV